MLEREGKTKDLTNLKVIGWERYTCYSVNIFNRRAEIYRLECNASERIACTHRENRLIKARAVLGFTQVIESSPTLSQITNFA